MKEMINAVITYTAQKDKPALLTALIEFCQRNKIDVDVLSEVAELSKTDLLEGSNTYLMASAESLFLFWKGKREMGKKYVDYVLKFILKEIEEEKTK